MTLPQTRPIGSLLFCDLHGGPLLPSGSVFALWLVTGVFEDLMHIAPAMQNSLDKHFCSELRICPPALPRLLTRFISAFEPFMARVPASEWEDWTQNVQPIASMALSHSDSGA
jgi:hypothetical protein